MLSDEDLRYIVQVLETPLGRPNYQHPARSKVNVNRRKIVRKYSEYQDEGLDWVECSVRARQWWLKDFLAKKEKTINRKK